MSRALLRSPSFIRAARRYLKKHPSAATDLAAALEQLSADPFHPSLRSHRLTGKLGGSWACSAGYDLRIIFSFAGHGKTSAIFLETVGTHDEVY